MKQFQQKNTKHNYSIWVYPLYDFWPGLDLIIDFKPSCVEGERYAACMLSGGILMMCCFGKGAFGTRIPRADACGRRNAACGRISALGLKSLTNNN